MNVGAASYDSVIYVLGGQLMAWLSRVPDVVWAALTASLVTLMGVWLANRHATKLLRITLENDAKQRNRERELSLRKDVYIEAVVGISGAHSILTRMQDLDAEGTHLSESFGEDTAAVAKIEMVGTNDTVKAVFNLIDAITGAYSELELKRLPLLARQDHIKLLQERVKFFNNEAERALEIIKKINIEGEIGEGQLDDANRWFDAASQKSKDISREINEEQKKQVAEHLEFSKLSHQRSAEVSKLIPLVIFEARMELDLPIDKEEYLRNLDASLERNQATLRRFIEEAKKKLDV